MSATTTALAETASSTLLHSLHSNERQLRTLAVVLSLTGGLALSFVLGVGIFIYWHCRQYKRRIRKTTLPKPPHLDSSVVTDRHPALVQQEMQDTENPPPSPTPPSPPSPPPPPPAPSAPIHLPPQLLLPPETNNPIESPTPSAPSAKELGRVSYPDISASHTPSASSVCVHGRQDTTMTHFRPHCQHCHHCSPPPPAYTPSRTESNVQFIDPE